MSELDQRLEATGPFFVRYIDDIVVLAPTHHKLRRAVKIINQTLAMLAMEKHPGKTFIGRAERGFDFLGYHISPGDLSVSRSTIQRFRERTHRLYEQERAGQVTTGTLDAYVRRWSSWSLAGLGDRAFPRGYI